MLMVPCVICKCVWVCVCVFGGSAIINGPHVAVCMCTDRIDKNRDVARKTQHLASGFGRTVAKLLSVRPRKLYHIHMRTVYILNNKNVKVQGATEWRATFLRRIPKKKTL